MTTPRFISPTTNIAARLRIWRWLLPLILFSIVVAYETLEHPLAVKVFVHGSFWWELGLFGLVMPVTVGVVLNWITGQVKARAEAEAQLQDSLVQLKQAEKDVRRANVALEQKVTERTQSLLVAYQKVAEQNEALQALDRLKSEFVSMVSHELRAPLTSINGGLELILAFDDDLAPDVRNSLQVMGQESARLTRLVENILNVSALEAGQLQLNLRPVALPPLIELTIQCHLLNSPEHRFQVDIQDDLPMALADEAYMYDILYNLIENAIKYATPSAGSEIKVATGEGQPAGGEEGGLIWISVTDNGPGIQPEEQEKIFDPFHRPEGQEKQEVYGHGLGLYFARQLMEAQNGKIWVECPPEQGSRFMLTLPVFPSSGLGEEMMDEPDDLIDR